MIIRNMSAAPIATMFEGKRVTLKPGVNDIDPKAWAAWRSTHTMKHMLATGKVKAPQHVAEEQAIPTLDKLKGPAAVALVKDTLDQELLERWVLAEKRPAVLKALEQQLEHVAIKPGDAAKGDEDLTEGEGEEPAGDDETAGS